MDNCARQVEFVCTRFPQAELMALACEKERRVRDSSRSSVLPNSERDDVEAAIQDDFDAEFYAEAYPDTAGSGFDPLRHFVRLGASQRRRPNLWFDTGYYLDANPDVVAASVNPFWHYVVSGKAEGRRPSRPRASLRAILDSLVEPASRTRHYPRPPRPALLEPGWLRSALDQCGATRDLAVSFSHDLYLRVVGGIQLFIADEQRAFSAYETDYLNISPFYPDLVLAEPKPSFVFSLVLNGEFLGQIEGSDLVRALEGGAGRSGRCTLIVHSLLGHDPSRIVEIHRALRSKRNFFWIHDFASLCPGFTLLRNNVAYCAAPPVDSHACRICIYGEQRRRERERYRRLFEHIEFSVVAPSSTALEVWLAADHPPARSVLVHPHCEIDAESECMSPDDGPARVAFIGFPTIQKGWQTFSSVLELPHIRQDHSFFHFSVRDGLTETPPGVKAIVAATSMSDRNAMVDLLRLYNIDLVIHASLGPETFSYVAHETLAAGADLVTLNASGNVASLAIRMSRGMVARDESAMVDLFASRTAAAYVELCRRQGKRYGNIRHTGTSASLPS